jgi:outer membrane protein W
MRKLLLLTVTGIGFCFVGFAQQTPNCSQTLRLATSTYEQGRLHEVQTILDGCLKNGDFSDQQKEQAYKLLCLTYLYLEEPEKADEMMLRLLQTNNEFQVNASADPAEFIALYNTFRTTPVYRFGFKTGTNVSQPNVVSSETVNDGTGKYSYKYGFNLGLSAEIPLFNNSLTLNPELFFRLQSFNYSNSEGYKPDTSRTASGFRKQTWIALPISLQYQFKKSKFNPYIGVGVETAFLSSAKADGLSSVTSTTPVELKTFDVTNDQNKINISALISLGAKYKIGRGLAILEIRYHYGFSNITKSSTAYANPFLTFDYQMVDAVYKINTLSINIGYLRNVYKPKKKNIK